MYIRPSEYLKLIVILLEKLAILALPIVPLQCCNFRFRNLTAVHADDVVIHLMTCPYHKSLQNFCIRVLDITFTRNLKQAFLVKIPMDELFNLIHHTKMLLETPHCEKQLGLSCPPYLRTEDHYHLLVTVTRQIIREIT